MSAPDERGQAGEFPVPRRPAMHNIERNLTMTAIQLSDLAEQVRGRKSGMIRNDNSLDGFEFELLERAVRYGNCDAQ